MDKEVLVSYHTVMSYELDSFGHVNNAVFLNYLEKARGDFMLSKGLSFKDFKKWNRFPVVTKATLLYKAPAFADDQLVIQGWISKHSPASFTLRYKIVHKDSEKLVLSGETTHVFIDDRNKPARIPEEFVNKFIN